VQTKDLSQALDELHNRLGLDQRFAAGDTPRNVTGCPLDGIDREGIVDCSAIIERVSTGFTRAGKEYSNLPRKLKIAIGGCPNHCHLPQINDIGFFGMTRQRGNQNEKGFGLLIGGGLSSSPYFAQSLRVFIRPDPDTVWDICRAVTSIFRECGHLRRNRRQARLKFHMADIGWENFRDTLQERLAFPLEHDDSAVFPLHANLDDHVGIHEQKDGRHSLGLGIKQGRLSGDDLIRLADLIEKVAADRAVTVATTTRQNLVIRNVPQDRILELNQALNEKGFSTSESASGVSVISCTGNEYCNFSSVETKQRAELIRIHLENKLALPQPVIISITGCPNCCAHYHLADIGLHGIGMTRNAERIEGFHVLVGGRLGADPVFARFVTDSGSQKRKIPAATIHLALEHLLNSYKRTACGEETFYQWVIRQPIQALDDLLINASEQDQHDF